MMKTLSILLLAAGANVAFATAIYTFTGTYSATAPDTELITPAKAFSGTVSIPEPTIPYNWSSNQTNVAVGLGYQLDGTPLATYLPHITMWTAGGASLIFLESDNKRVRLNFGGPVMFTGPTSAPVLVLPFESLNTAGSWSYHNSDGSVITSGAFTNATLTTTPEPASAALLASGFLLCVLLRRK